MPIDHVTEFYRARRPRASRAFLWASGASTLLVLALRELSAANRRFDDFVREIALLQPPQSRRRYDDPHDRAPHRASPRRNSDAQARADAGRARLRAPSSNSSRPLADRARRGRDRSRRDVAATLELKLIAEPLTAH